MLIKMLASLLTGVVFSAQKVNITWIKFKFKQTGTTAKKK